MTRTPNILFIMSDEHRKDAMGCMNHPIVKTPNLDALAARGTLFERAYTPSPMCVPTRAAVATGRWVHQTGHWDSATAYAGDPPSWMHALRDAGREVVSIGKLHFRSTEDDTGFSREILPMHVVGGVGWATGLLRENPPPYGVARELAGDVGTGPSTYTDYDREITAAAEDWLADPARADRPWAAFVSLVSPHYPLTCPAEWSALYDPADMDLPVGFHDRPAHPALAHMAALYNYDDYFDDARTRAAKAAYYGLTSFMDDCVGRVLAALASSGQADDTIVIYVSDHGDMMGDQGFWTKMIMYEQSAGVPMMMAGPGVPAGRRMITCTSLVDLAATARDIAGLAADPSAPGRSLLGLATGAEDADRTGFSEYHDGGSRSGSFMVRFGDWKYVHYAGDAPQLFNLDRDPNELEDVAASGTAETRAALAEGRERLRAICDPDEVNARAFADQRMRIAELGGEEACRTAYLFNHTPTPVEQARLRDGGTV